MLVGVYVSAIGLKQVPLVHRRVSWNATTALSLLPVVLVVLFATSLFFNHFETFLAIVGVSLAPMCGVRAADYFLLRRGRGGVDVRGCSVAARPSRTTTGGGVNPAGFLGIAAGFVAYVYLLNSISYASHFPYQYVSASIPSALVAGAVYVACTLLFVIPAGRGGYDRRQNRP